MLTKPSTLAAAVALLTLTTACVSSPRGSAPVTPPRREMPETATKPCALPRLGPAPTLADLETAYTARGAAIVACDGARQLAVGIHAGEHADEDRWLLEVAKPSTVLGLPR